MLKRLRHALQRKPGAPAGRPEPPRSLVVDVADADFAEVIAGHDGLVVVDVWADWCEPCRPMSAFVEFLAQDYAGRLLVAALDADENPQTTERYQVMGLPTLLFLRRGTEVGRQVGLAPYEELRRQVDALLPAELPPTL